MKINSVRIHDNEQDGLAPELQRLLGLKVLGAWTRNTTLYVRFERDMFLEAEAPAALGLKVITCKVAHSNPGATFDFLDRFPGVTPFPPVIGRRFTGMDGTVVEFGRVGARMTVEGVVWVREA